MDNPFARIAFVSTLVAATFLSAAACAESRWAQIDAGLGELATEAWASNTVRLCLCVALLWLLWWWAVWAAPHIHSLRGQLIDRYIQAALLKGFHTLGDPQIAKLKQAIADGTLETTERAGLDQLLARAEAFLRASPVWPIIAAGEALDPAWRLHLETSAIALANRELSAVLNAAPAAAAPVTPSPIVGPHGSGPA
jgi:hypothetical protein